MKYTYHLQKFIARKDFLLFVTMLIISVGLAVLNIFLVSCTPQSAMLNGEEEEIIETKGSFTTQEAREIIQDEFGTSYNPFHSDNRDLASRVVAVQLLATESTIQNITAFVDLKISLLGQKESLHATGRIYASHLSYLNIMSAKEESIRYNWAVQARCVDRSSCDRIVLLLQDLRVNANEQVRAPVQEAQMADVKGNQQTEVNVVPDAHTPAVKSEVAMALGREHKSKAFPGGFYPYAMIGRGTEDGDVRHLILKRKTLVQYIFDQSR